MGSLATGAFMVLFFIILNAVVAFVQGGAIPSDDAFNCNSQGNATTCEEQSPASFLETFFDVAITGIDNAPVIINGFYILISVGLLVIGFALIVQGIIATPLGAG